MVHLIVQHCNASKIDPRAKSATSLNIHKSIRVRIQVSRLDIFCPMNGTFAHRLGVSVTSEEKPQETLAKFGEGL